MANEEGSLRKQVREANPFALPSNTGFRFSILILFIVGATFQLPRMTISTIDYFTGRLETLAASAAACLNRGREIIGSALEELDFGQDFDPWPAMQLLENCIEDYTSYQWFLGLTVLAFLISTLVFFWSVPFRIMWRGRLRPLPLDRYIHVHEALRSIEQEAGVRSIRYVWNPLTSDAPYVFAGLGKLYAYLPGKFITDLKKDPDGFRSVMLHEFAHVQNRDVRLAFFTKALWWAFVICILMPAALTCALCLFIDTQNQVTWLLNLCRVALIGCLAFQIRCSLMRAREHDADVRASADPSCREAIVARLRDAIDRDKKENADHCEEEQAAKISLLLTAFSDYPSKEKRIDIIKSPSLLFGASTSEFFALAFTILQFIGILVSMFLLALQVKWAGPIGIVVFSIIVLLFYPTLIFLVFGISIGRLQFNELVSGVANRKGVPALACGAAAGLCLGFAATNTLGDIYLGVGYAAFVEGTSKTSGVTTVLPMWQLFIVHLLMLGIHTLLFLLSFSWLRQFASAWLPIIATRRSLSAARALSIALLLLAGIALSILPISFLIVDLFIKSLLWLSPDELPMQYVAFMPVVLLFNPLNGLPMLAAGILPIAAALFWWTRDQRRLASWTLLTSANGEPQGAAIAGPPMQPLRSTAIGVGIAAGAWLLLLPSDADDFKAQTEFFAFWFFPIIEFLENSSLFENASLSFDGETKIPVTTWFFPMMILISGLGIVAGALLCSFSDTTHGIVSGFLATLLFCFFLPDKNFIDVYVFWFIVVCLYISFLVTFPLLLIISLTKCRLRTRGFLAPATT